MAQFALKMCFSAQNRQKNLYKALFWRSRSSKVIEFNANQEPVYDFLLVINSNLSPYFPYFVSEIQRLIG